MSRGLIVVDVQKDFCEGGSVPVAGGAQIATAIAELVEQSADGHYQYVVATRDHHIDPGSHFSSKPDFKDSFPVHCVAGDEGGEFHPNFAPAVASGKVHAVFFKGAHSASKSGFEGADTEGTSLADWLRARGCGTSTWWASQPTTACAPPPWTLPRLDSEPGYAWTTRSLSPPTPLPPLWTTSARQASRCPARHRRRSSPAGRTTPSPRGGPHSRNRFCESSLDWRVHAPCPACVDSGGAPGAGVFQDRPVPCLVGSGLQGAP